MLVLAIGDLRLLLRTADVAAAMSVEALLGTDRAFAEDLVALRPQPGQARSAANLRRLLAGSAIVASHRYGDPRVQDAYSLRCAPQVLGAARDALTNAEATAQRELAAAIDNPMVLPDGRVESCGNFHGAPLGLACDTLAIAIAQVGAIAERRTDRLLDAKRSQGLPPFLAADPGVDSGMMIAHYTQAAMVAANRRHAVPASSDSLPTSAMQEDHVSMAWGAARKLREAVANLQRIVAVELVCAARGIELRSPLEPAAGTGAALAAIREAGAGPGIDRYLAPELEAVTDLSPPRPSAKRRRPRLGSSRERPARGARSRAGTELRCKGWQQEGALRMLENNLDPDVAERPDDLVVYGGTGRAARSWEAFDAIVSSLEGPRGRRDASGPVRQAGRGLPHARVVAACPHRQLQSRPRLGELGGIPAPRVARPHDVRADDRGLLDLHREPGDRAGHL